MREGRERERTMEKNKQTIKQKTQMPADNESSISMPKEP